MAMYSKIITINLRGKIIYGKFNPEGEAQS